jgi:hypothetical protein
MVSSSKLSQSASLRAGSTCFSSQHSHACVTSRANKRSSSSSRSSSIVAVVVVAAVVIVVVVAVAVILIAITLDTMVLWICLRLPLVSSVS